MIRLDLIDHRGHYIKSVDLQKDEIKVGRALHCDLIIPDFHIEAEEIFIRKNENAHIIRHKEKEETLKGETKVKLHQYKVRVTDLAYYAGDIKADSQEKEWSYTLIIASLTLAAVLIERFLFNLSPIDGWQEFKNISAALTGFAAFIFLLSLATRALNGEYRIWKITNVVLTSSLVAALIEDNGLGIRWILPFFHINQIWALLFYAWGGLTLWYLAEVILDHIAVRIRLNVILGLLLLILVGHYSAYLPAREKYEYFSSDPEPPRAEILESRPLEADEFKKELDQAF